MKAPLNTANAIILLAVLNMRSGAHDIYTLKFVGILHHLQQLPALTEGCSNENADDCAYLGKACSVE